MFEALVGILAGEAEWAKVDQGEVRVRASGDEVGAAFLETVRQRLGVGDHRLCIVLELGLQRLTESDGLRRDDVHEWTAPQSGEDRRIDLLRDGFVVGQHHAATRAARVLCVVVVTTCAWPNGVGCSPAATSPAKWAMSTRRSASTSSQICAEAGEIEVARIGRTARDDHLRAMLLGEPLDLIEVDEVVVPGGRRNEPR